MVEQYFFRKFRGFIMIVFVNDCLYIFFIQDLTVLQSVTLNQAQMERIKSTTFLQKLECIMSSFTGMENLQKVLHFNLLLSYFTRKAVCLNLHSLVDDHLLHNKLTFYDYCKTSLIRFLHSSDQLYIATHAILSCTYAIN